MNAFGLVNSINDTMASFNKPYNERTGFLMGVMGCIMNELKYKNPEAYTAAEKYIEEAVAALIIREQEKLNDAVTAA
jgi:hypothetical protein